MCDFDLSLNSVQFFAPKKNNLDFLFSVFLLTQLFLFLITSQNDKGSPYIESKGG